MWDNLRKEKLHTRPAQNPRSALCCAARPDPVASSYSLLSPPSPRVEQGSACMQLPRMTWGLCRRRTGCVGLHRGAVLWNGSLRACFSAEFARWPLPLDLGWYLLYQRSKMTAEWGISTHSPPKPWLLQNTGSLDSGWLWHCNLPYNPLVVTIHCLRNSWRKKGMDSDVLS